MSWDLKQPFFDLGGKRSVTLPQEILDQLLPFEEPDELSDRHRPISHHLREIMEARRMDRADLHRLMQWSDNTTKSYRLIDSAIDGSKIHEGFVRRAFEVLGLTGDAIDEIFAEDKSFNIHRHHEVWHRRYHDAYRDYGPHIYPMPLSTWRPCVMNFTSDGWRYLQVPFGVGPGLFYVRVPFSVENNTFNVPSVEEISQAIADPPPWFRKPPRECFGALLYHRLPEEMIYYDMDGKIISQGDTLMPYPEGVRRLG